MRDASVGGKVGRSSVEPKTFARPAPSKEPKLVPIQMQQPYRRAVARTAYDRTRGGSPYSRLRLRVFELDEDSQPAMAKTRQLAELNEAASCFPSGTHRPLAHTDVLRESPRPPATDRAAYHRPRTP